MKLKTIGLAWLVLGMPLAATAQTLSRSMPAPIVVTVQDGSIAVSDSEFRASSTATTWAIGTAGYTFIGGGIDFGSAQSQFSCSTVNQGQGMRCSRSAGSTGRFAYSVRLVSQTAGQTLQSTDPNVIWVNSD